MIISHRVVDHSNESVTAILSALFQQTSKADDRKVALGVFGDDVGALKRLSRHLEKCPLVAVVGLRITKSQIPRVLSLSQVPVIEISNSGLKITCYPDWRLPETEWSETPSAYCQVSLTLSESEDCIGEGGSDMTTTSVRIDKMMNVIRDVAKLEAHQIHCCSTTVEHDRLNIYTFYVLRVDANTLLNRLCEALDINEAFVFTRLQCSVNETIQGRLSQFGLEAFALTNCKDVAPRMISMGALTAIGPDSYSFPVPNVSFEQVVSIWPSLLAARKTFMLATLGRSFLQWKSDSGELSSCSAGNFIQVQLSPKSCKVILGIEQYSDADPPVRCFSGRLKRALHQLDFK